LGMGGTANNRLVQLQYGDLVLNKEHTIVSIRVMPQDEPELQRLIGRRVYIAGKKLIDVTDKEPQPLTDLGQIITISPLTA
jgi:hypothetical protein